MGVWAGPASWFSPELAIILILLLDKYRYLCDIYRVEDLRWAITDLSPKFNCALSLRCQDEPAILDE